MKVSTLIESLKSCANDDCEGCEYRRLTNCIARMEFDAARVIEAVAFGFGDAFKRTFLEMDIPTLENKETEKGGGDDESTCGSD